MAAPLTKEELLKAREELDRVNREQGLRPGGGTPPPPPPPANEGGGPPEPQEPPPDPGPPRFIGIDLDKRLAGLSGGGVVPITEEQVQQIVRILLQSLQSAMGESYRAIAGSHGLTKKGKQLELFKDQPLNDDA